MVLNYAVEFFDHGIEHYILLFWDITLCTTLTVVVDFLCILKCLLSVTVIVRTRVYSNVKFNFVSSLTMYWCSLVCLLLLLYYGRIYCFLGWVCRPMYTWCGEWMDGWMNITARILEIAEHTGRPSSCVLCLLLKAKHFCCFLMVAMMISWKFGYVALFCFTINLIKSSWLTWLGHLYRMKNVRDIENM